MFTLLNILLVAILLMLVVLTAVSASMSSHTAVDMDLKDTPNAKDHDRSDDAITEGLPSFQIGGPSAGALPGNYQSNRSLATYSKSAASTPK